MTVDVELRGASNSINQRRSFAQETFEKLGFKTSFTGKDELSECVASRFKQVEDLFLRYTGLETSPEETVFLFESFASLKFCSLPDSSLPLLWRCDEKTRDQYEGLQHLSVMICVNSLNLWAFGSLTSTAVGRLLERVRARHDDINDPAMDPKTNLFEMDSMFERVHALVDVNLPQAPHFSVLYLAWATYLGCLQMRTQLDADSAESHKCLNKVLSQGCDSKLLIRSLETTNCFEYIEKVLSTNLYAKYAEPLSQVLIGLLTTVPCGFDITVLPQRFVFLQLLSRVLSLNRTNSDEFWAELDQREPLQPQNALYLPQLVFPFLVEPLLYLLVSVCRSELAAKDVFTFFSNLQNFAIALGDADESLYVATANLPAQARLQELKSVGYLNQNVVCSLYYGLAGCVSHWVLPANATVLPLPFANGLSVVRSPYSGWHLTLSQLQVFLRLHSSAVLSSASWGKRNDELWQQATSGSVKQPHKPLLDVVAILTLWKCTLEHDPESRAQFMAHLLEYEEGGAANEQGIIKLVVDVITRASLLCSSPSLTYSGSSLDAALIAMGRGIGVLEQWLPLYSEFILPYIRSWLHEGTIAKLWMAHEQRLSTFEVTRAFVKLLKTLATLVMHGDLPDSKIASTCLELGVQRVRALVFESLDTWRFSKLEEKLALQALCLDYFALFTKSMRGELPGQLPGQSALARAYMRRESSSSYLPILRLFTSANTYRLKSVEFVTEVRHALYAACNFVKLLLQWDKASGSSIVEQHLLQISGGSQSCELLPALVSLLMAPVDADRTKLCRALADMLATLVSISYTEKHSENSGTGDYNHTPEGLVGYLGPESKLLCKFLITELSKEPKTAVDAVLLTSYWDLCSALIVHQPSLSSIFLEESTETCGSFVQVLEAVVSRFTKADAPVYFRLVVSFARFTQLLWQREAQYFFFIKKLAFNDNFKRSVVELFVKFLKLTALETVSDSCAHFVLDNEHEISLQVAKFLICETLLELFAKWTLSNILPDELRDRILNHVPLWELLLSCPESDDTLRGVQMLLTGKEAYVKRSPWYTLPAHTDKLIDEKFINVEAPCDTFTQSSPSNSVYNWQAVIFHNKSRTAEDLEYLLQNAIEYNRIWTVSQTHWLAVSSWTKFLLPEARNLEFNLVKMVLASLCKHITTYSGRGQRFNFALCEIMLFAIKSLKLSDAQRQLLLAGLLFVLVEECKDSDVSQTGSQLQNIIVCLLELVSTTKLFFADQVLFGALLSILGSLVKQCVVYKWQDDSAVLTADLVSLLLVKFGRRLPPSLWLESVTSRLMGDSLLDCLPNLYGVFVNSRRKPLASFAVHLLELHAYWANTSQNIAETLAKSVLVYQAMSILSPHLVQNDSQLSDGSAKLLYRVWLAMLKLFAAMSQPEIPASKEFDDLIANHESRVVTLFKVSSGRGFLIEETCLWADIWAVYYAKKSFGKEPANPFAVDLISRQRFRDSGVYEEDMLLLTQIQIEDRSKLLKLSSWASAMLLRADSSPKALKAMRGLSKLQRSLWRLDALLYTPVEQLLYYVESLHLSLCASGGKSSLHDTFAFLASADAELYGLSLSVSPEYPSFGTLFKQFSLATEAVELDTFGASLWLFELLENVSLLLLEAFLFHWFLPQFKINHWIQARGLTVDPFRASQIEWKQIFVEHGLLAAYKETVTSAMDVSQDEEGHYVAPLSKMAQATPLSGPVASSPWSRNTPRHFSATRTPVSLALPTVSPLVPLSQTARKRSTLNQPLSRRDVAHPWSQARRLIPTDMLNEMSSYRLQLSKVIQTEIAAHYNRALTLVAKHSLKKQVKSSVINVLSKSLELLDSVSREYTNI